MLLVFVVETTHTNDSDKMYINKYLVSRFPQVETCTDIVVQWVYLNGKTNYKNNSIERKINNYKTGYLRYHPQSRDIHVIYCIDVDDTDKNRDSARLNSEIFKYCSDKGYRLVWFNKTIEHVFLGKLIHQAKDKKTEARNYYRKTHLPQEYCDSKYKQNQLVEVRVQTSNIGCVLEELFRE